MYNPETGKVEFEDHETKKLDTYDYHERLSFKGRWATPDQNFEFIVHFYPYNNSVEIYDLTHGRTFMKRLRTNVRHHDLFLGNKLSIYNRHIKLISFANDFTRNNIVEMRSLCILKPILKCHQYGPILKVLEKQDLRIAKLTMCVISRKDALQFYHYLRGRAICPFMVEHLASGASLGIEMVGQDAVSRLYSILGPRTPAEGRKVAPHTLRAIYGHDRIVNALHGSVRRDLVENELNIFFPEKQLPPTTTAVYENSTLCIVKTHILKDRRLGELITYIGESHFKITAMDSFYLTMTDAEEFQSRKIVPDFMKYVEPFMDGYCVAIEISGRVPDMNVCDELRKFLGPKDPVVAREIVPYSLRARFGIDRYKNACYGSDSNTEAQYELEFFFKILRRNLHW
ncbi:unnamed protein product [Brassicogethes aeneus]|uniref:DM10 domain-containing protein n=1 Tax=Brassicogethes aeneus TaxID=1431903 RepID=A0A9P0AVE3_BRAAE|nr:unnamed protein product [Brassicogethes aeneus]